jgi:hypothetical protein
MTDSNFAAGSAPVIIKKNGDRLIDTSLNTFATLNTLSLYLKQNQKFVVIDERSGEDLTRDVLMRINLQADTLDLMRTLVRENRLPHDLLDHHWFRGTVRNIGPHEIVLGQGCDYFPVDSIKVFDAIPATLAKKDYSRARVTERFQRSKQHALEKTQARVAAGKKGNDRLEGLTEDYGLRIEIDGIAYRLHDSWLDEAIPHKKIIDAVLKPLGYANVKGEKNRYQKQVSETEFLTCSFDLHALWGRVRELRASMGYRWGEKQVVFPLIYWGAFNWIEWMKVENMNPMTITTERIFTMAIDNIGFLLTILGSELFRALAYCSERAEYCGSAQRAPLIVGVASEHRCSCAAALSWLKANRPNVQELEETHQDLT